MSEQCTIFACSIFRNELELLRKEGKVSAEVIYLDSMLHMHPEKLEMQLESKISGQKDFSLVLYGDCHARITDNHGANRLKVIGINCCEILLGSEQYLKLRKEGAFILLPEWMVRWKEVFQVEMGFKDSSLARKFMNEMHTELVYADTQIIPVPFDTLDEISAFTGLHYRIVKCGTENLLKAISVTKNSKVNER